MSQPQHIAIVGAGIAGMFSALALAKAGLRVSLMERDVPPPEGDADKAFFEWQRRGAAQFRHPHAFLGLMCSIIEENHPELLEAFLAAGARRLRFAEIVPPDLLAKYEPQPGDEKLWILLCRRATLETILRRHVAQQPNVEIHNTTYVTGILTETQSDQLAVTGLQLTDRANDNARSTFSADAYVDAAGRASKFRQWLQAVGAQIPEQRDAAEIVYYTRHYQLKEGIAEPSRHDHEPFAGDLGYLKYGVFQGDGGNFAVIVCLPNDETELREAIKDGAQFDSICMQIPGLKPWLSADQSDATTPPFGIGEIHAVWRDYVVDDLPVAANYFAIGDAAARTNPLYGRGCSTGILQAHLLADLLKRPDDPVTRAIQFAKQTNEQIRPIFDASLREDKNGIKRADAVKQGLDRDKAGGIKKWFALAFGDALAAAARSNIHVFRGMMRTVNLIEIPGDFLKDKKIRNTILLYMFRGRKRNAKARVQAGPSRSDMLAHAETLN